MERDLVGSQGGGELAADPGPVADPLAELLVEDLETSRSGAVSLERRLGVTDERLGGGIRSVGDDDADRRRGGEDLDPEVEGIVEGGEDRRGEVDDVRAAAGPGS